MKTKIIAGALLLTVWIVLTFMVLYRAPRFASGRDASENTPPTPKVDVVVTIPILKDLVLESCEAYVNVTTIVTHDVEVETFQPSPKGIVAVNEADVLIKAGAGLDSWVDAVVADLERRDLTIVDLSENVGLFNRQGRFVGSGSHIAESKVDAYFWLDPSNVREMVLAIQLAIIGLLPEAAKYFEQRRQDYFGELDALESDISDMLIRASKLKMIAGCDGMTYLARRFNLALVDRLENLLPRVLEPSAMRRLIDKLSANKIDVIVVDELSDTGSAEQLLASGQFRTVVLASATGGGANSATYVQLMRYNALSLMSAADDVAGIPSNETH